MKLRDENKELAIRQHAMQMVVEKGFDGLSMQKLAKAAGVSPATIYIYFKDREDLILQLCQEANQRLIDATLKDFDPNMGFEEGMRVQWKNRSVYCLENPVESSFLEQVRHSHYNEKFGEQVKQVFIASMGGFMKNAIQKGELKPMQKEIFWSVAYAPLYQLVKYHLSGKGLGCSDEFVLTDSILNETLNVVLKALKA